MNFGKQENVLEMRGIEPRAFRMQSEHSTTELHPPYNGLTSYYTNN